MAIPLPGLPGESFLKGLDTGSTLFSRMIQPQLERERMRQQQKQFEQQQARLNQLAPLQRQLLQEQITSAQHKNDPMYELNNLQNMMQMFGGQAQGQQQPMPQQEFGEGMGMFSPEGLQQAQQQPQGQQGGMDWNMIRTNPLLRGYFKQKFGIDPGASNPFQGPAREAMDLERLRQEQGEDSPVYQNALASYNAKRQAQEDLSGIRGRQLSGLKPGERWIYGDNSEILGKEIPLTATERNEYRGRGFFNNILPIMNKGLPVFSGQGSIKRFEQAASRYGVDPQATEMIDNYLLGQKLLTAGVVKEAATLGAGKQKKTYDQLRQSLESSDIPKSISRIVKQFQLPAAAELKANQNFQRVLNEATRAGEQAVPAYQQQYFNPSKQALKATEGKDLSELSDAELQQIIAAGGG